MWNISPRLLHPLGQQGRRKDAMRFEEAVRAPVRTQEAMLQALLRRHQATAFGRAHGFASLRNPAEFAAQVPLMHPQDLRPWVERLMNGERQILTDEDPLFYGVSTGTSGTHKHVPITATYRDEFQRTVNIAFWHLYRRFPEAFTSRFLYFVGPRRLATAPDGRDIGSMSGYNYTELPPLVRSLYAWPYEVFEVEDLPSRAYLALHQAIAGDVSLITGIFPLPIVMLLRDLETQAEALARDFERGRLDGAPGLSPAERDFFARHLRPRPDLARRLRRAMALPVEEKVAEVLPKLRLTYCWTTSTAGLYLGELRRRLGSQVRVRDAIYAATEAWCNVCLGDEEPGGPLAITSVYFEFIEATAYEAGSTATQTLGELEDGRRYYLVVTNSAGMYRYVLGDVVETCGRYQDTPRIRFVRKAGATSNLCGELLDEVHVNEAMRLELERSGLEATWFALVGDSSGPGYTLHLELAPACAEVGSVVLQEMAARVDADLGRQALFYGQHRKARLHPLQVKRVDQGTYDRYRMRRMRDGTGEAQIKAIHLVADRSALPEELRD